MPALVLGRKWEVGTDDLVIPYAVSAAARLVWIILVTYVFVANVNSVDMLLKIHLLLLAVLQACLCVVETVVSFISSRGTMKNSAPRRGLPATMYLHACFLALVLAWSIVGVVLAYGPCIECDLATTVLVLSYLTIVWNVLVALGMALYLRIIKVDACGTLLKLGTVKKYGRLMASETLKARGRRLSRVSNGSLAQHLKQKTWQWKLEFVLCHCLRWEEEDQRVVCSEVAGVLAEEFFKSEDYDYVSTDILAGLELIAMAEESPEELPKTPVDFNAEASCSEMVQMERCLRFANGSYGWPLYFHSQGCCRVCAFMYNHCRCNNAETREDILGDNRCRWNAESLKQFTGLEDADLIYLSFQSEVFCPAFYVAYDHHESTVLVVIRGSLSLCDILADLSAHPSLLTTVGSLDIYTHKGIMNAAHTMQLKLETNKLLDKAFEMHPEYKLVLVGHSFGAGVASLLAILLKHRYPKLHCYAFAPPGGLINIESVYYTRTFITTMVVGNDMVPRLSQKSFETLSEKVDYYIKACSVPKYRVFLSAFLHRLGIHKWNIHSEISEQLSSEESLAGSDEDVIFEKVLTSEKSSRDKAPGEEQQVDGRKTEPEIMKVKSLVQMPLFVAGKVIHISWEPVTGTRPTLGWWHKRERTLVANWVPPTNFSELFIGKDMFHHHLPDVMLKAFDELLTQENLFAIT